MQVTARTPSIGTERARAIAARLLHRIRYEAPSPLIDSDPHRAALLAGAMSAVEHGTSNWWSTSVLPFEALFRVVDEVADAADCESPEHVAYLLLLVRAQLGGR